MRALSSLLVGVTLAVGCTDECKSLAPAFELEIDADTGGSSLVVVVEMNGERGVHVFNLTGDLDDGEASIVIELDPALMLEFEVELIATAYAGLDGAGRVIGAAQKRFDGTPDGCNRFYLDLRREPPPDSGMDPDAPDAGDAPDTGAAPDGGVAPDGGAPDTGVPDVEACSPTCATADCTSICTLECATCSMSCAGSDRCTAVCQGMSSCAIDCAGVRDCEAECSGRSDCEVDCGGAQDCKSRCVGQATCRLNCLDANQCMFTACEGSGQTTCGDGSIVCNRACP